MLPAKYRIEGYQDVLHSVIPKYVRDDWVVYDIGGGKNPYVTIDMKSKLNLHIIGVDINENELNTAPLGVYDKKIVADITKYEGTCDGDLAVCLAVLEHVQNVEAALRGINSCLKRGGLCVIFVPSKNAIYAKINRILPQDLKKKILFSIFPNCCVG
ncbi:class I SAM-dependent methyltransferase [Methanothrix thermoacetophila]|uniref:class I SAM-dependent methyltransferase n=1 Tax=Methanothrix thermoacetophila TaxID=2224 RepID=UPI0015859215|nr:methyltransferase domain-containing protein [Methanothrix thermoacetophila]